MAAAQIAIHHGIQGPSLTVSTACSSGGDALAAAALLLWSGEADAVVTVGAESILCPLVLYSLSNAKALSHRNDLPGACQPPVRFAPGRFCDWRRRRRDCARDRRTRQKTRGGDLWGTAGLGEQFRRLPCDRTAAGRYSGRQPVCGGHWNAPGVQPQEVGYINAHGTATPLGDAAEAAAIRQVFGAFMPPVSSTKGATGHMMGAGGITEAIACILAMREGLLPPTLHWETPDPACSLDCIPGRARPCTVEICMSNAFGFGGQNSQSGTGEISQRDRQHE